MAFVLVGYGPLWTHTRHLATLVHESGHALVALATGRRLNSVTLRANTSGLTVSSGPQRGPGMIATAAAGYLAPAAFGLIMTWLIRHGQSSWAWWIWLGALVLMLLHIRNWFGLLVVGLVGAGVAAILWRATAPIQELAALLVAWFLLFAAPRAAIELPAHRRTARTRSSDADVLARLTHLPALLWVLMFILLDLGALALGAWWLGLDQVIG